MHVDAGGFNPLLGKSYGEIAAASRSQHKSQGFGVAPARGTVVENFSPVDGAEAKTNLMEGIDISWQRAGAPAISTMIDSIIYRYDLSDPSLSVPALLNLYNAIGALKNSHWKTVKLAELRDVIGQASGVWIDAYSDQSSVKQGDNIGINFSVNNRQGINIKLDSVSAGGFDTLLNQPTEKNRNINFTGRIAVPANKAISQPYWLQEKMSEGSYNVNKQLLIGVPDALPAFTAAFSLTIGGTPFTYTLPIKYKHTDPVKGEIYEPLVVMPSAANASAYGQLKHIHYDHIPDIYYFRSDTVKITLTGLKTAGKKIGYLEGAGDKVPAALALMGYQVTVLKENDLTPAYLSQFDAVMTGVRAYNVHGYLLDKNEALKQYVKNGGNFIVQYNVNGNTDLHGIGPYPFTISRDRITDEHSPVRFLLPQHRVLNYPNKITPADFEGWKQERAIYLGEQPDPAFQAPLSMSDPSEDEQTGSLLIADYGKGKFVYTGIVFFRELPAGVNGAYRLLANIIALNQQIK